MSEIHIERDGDKVIFSGEGSVSEAREDLTQLVKDLDETAIGPRLEALAGVVKDYIS